MSGKLTPSQKNQLQTWLGGGLASFEFLYSFTRDGSTATAFHTKCDNKGPTVTVIYNTEGTVYGGYTEVSWQSVSSGAYSTDTRAFLFRLQLNGKTACEKFPCSKNTDKAVHSNATHGPIFGGGHDLYTFNGDLTASSGVYTLNGSVSLNNTYDSKGITSTDFCNDIKTITELEVYKVTGNVEFQVHFYNLITQYTPRFSSYP